MFVRSRAKGLSRESGQVVVLFAILLPVLFGLGAIVLDIGNWYVHKRHLQTQVDAAALAAASGFSSCFFDPASANLGIASTALSYAGDTARDPSSTNQQVQTPGSVRVTLNSQRYWAAGDPATPTTTGYGATDPTVGDNSAGTPCATSTLDVKATDFDVPKLFSWLGIRPDIKAHARVEIHAVKEESGFLPLAVPEIDPNYVYAIFVDYRDERDSEALKVQPLKKDPSYCPPPGSPCTFPYSAWVTNTDVPRPRTQNAAVTLHPDAANSDGTGVVILVSKSDVAPRGRPQAPQRDLQPDADRPRPVLRRHGQRRLRRRGVRAGTGVHPQLRDEQCTADRRPAAAPRREPRRHGVHRPHRSREPLRPVLRERGQRLHGGRHRKGRLWRADDARERRSEEEAESGRLLRGSRTPGLGPSSTNGTVSTWTGTLPVPEVGGPQVLTLELAGQDLRHQLQQPQQRDLWQGRHGVRDGRQFRSGRLRQAHGVGAERLDDLPRREWSFGCELDPAWQLLLLGHRGARRAAGAEAVEQPQHRPTLWEQGGPQGRHRDRQPQRLAPLRRGQDAGGLVLERLLHDLWPELTTSGARRSRPCAPRA